MVERNILGLILHTMHLHFQKCFNEIYILQGYCKAAVPTLSRSWCKGKHSLTEELNWILYKQHLTWPHNGWKSLREHVRLVSLKSGLVQLVPTINTIIFLCLSIPWTRTPIFKKRIIVTWSNIAFISRVFTLDQLMNTVTLTMRMPRL